MDDNPSDPTMYLPAESGSRPGLKVIVAGMPRTATSSLVMALNELGFGPCHHMATLMATPKTAGLWNKAWKAQFEGIGTMTKADWDRLLDGYWSVGDNPAHNFADVLAEHYPEAKIILNYRDAEGWCTSIMNTIMPLSTALPHVITYLDWYRREVWALFYRIHHHHNFNMDVAASSPNPRQILHHFHKQHYTYMKAVLPADRMVEWNVKDGWEPICKLLDVPVPDKPFPRAHDTEKFESNGKAKIAKFARAGILTFMSAIGVAVTAAVGPAAYRYVAANFL